MLYNILFYHETGAIVALPALNNSEASDLFTWLYRASAIRKCGASVIRAKGRVTYSGNM
jgi:hypothetical protein